MKKQAHITIKVVLIAFISLIILNIAPAFSDVAAFDFESNGTLSVEVFNRISEKDIDEISTIIKGNGKATTSVFLDSSGGDVLSAIKIGRIMRAANAWARMREHSICYSSCVFLLAAGPLRLIATNDTRVGIHRPYLENDQETTVSGQVSQQHKIENIIKEYLSDMNIPLALYDDMLRISPETMKILSESELERYGLSLDDPYLEDALNTGMAKKLGYSRKEYLERKATANTVCNSLPKNQIAQCFNDWLNTRKQ